MSAVACGKLSGTGWALSKQASCKEAADLRERRMDMNYYVGLDNGGTTTKAAIFDAKGKEIATASTATKMLVPQPGFTERDMEEMAIIIAR